MTLTVPRTSTSPRMDVDPSNPAAGSRRMRNISIERPSYEEVLKEYKVRSLPLSILCRFLQVHTTTADPRTLLLRYAGICSLAQRPKVYISITGIPILLPFPSNLIHLSLYRRNTSNVHYDLAVRTPPESSENWVVVHAS